MVQSTVKRERWFGQVNARTAVGTTQVEQLRHLENDLGTEGGRLFQQPAPWLAETLESARAQTVGANGVIVVAHGDAGDAPVITQDLLPGTCVLHARQRTRGRGR